jgi:hypothetical protein
MTNMASVMRAEDTTRREKRRRIHDALDAEAARVVTIAAIAGVDRFQAEPVWEMSGNTIIAVLRSRPPSFVRACNVGAVPSGA